MESEKLSHADTYRVCTRCKKAKHTGIHMQAAGNGYFVRRADLCHRAVSQHPGQGPKLPRPVYAVGPRPNNPKVEPA